MQGAASWRSRAGRAALALTAVLVAGSAARAQNFVHAPNLNIGPKVPQINPNVAHGNIAVGVVSKVHTPNVVGVVKVQTPNAVGVVKVQTPNAIGVVSKVQTPNPVGAVSRVRTPDVAGRVNDPTPNLAARVNINPTMPYLHYSPNLYPSCGAAFRDSDGDCLGEPVATTGGGGSSSGRGKGGSKAGRNNTVQTALSLRSYNNRIVAELEGTFTAEQAEALGRRHGLRRLSSQAFPLIGATVGLFQITNGRSYEAASRDFAAAGGVVSVQPDFRYLLQEQKAGQAEGDPAQYALAKLRLPEAHTLSHGVNVLVAVIDSGIDARHPELAGSVIDSFDALGSGEGPHVHGTGIAGAIASHARLMGAAPSVRLIAIRAFGQGSVGVESSSFVILRSLDHAVSQHAQIINMSFAGPKDALIERAINAVAGRGIVMIAASGNAGAKSPPLYPAANPHVIAVSATDADDKLFEASNRGSHIALAAPGAEIFLPAPDQKYQITSGTSFSAAYVSGVAALMLERNPALKPDDLRAILTRTARDLGSPGRDDLFGAGEADAYAAVEASIVPEMPVATSDGAKADEKRVQSGVERSLTPPVAAAIETGAPAAQ